MVFICNGGSETWSNKAWYRLSVVEAGGAHWFSLNEGDTRKAETHKRKQFIRIPERFENRVWFYGCARQTCGWSKNVVWICYATVNWFQWWLTSKRRGGPRRPWCWVAQATKQNNNDLRASSGCGVQLAEYPESHRRDPIVEWLPLEFRSTLTKPSATQAWCPAEYCH